MRAGVVSSSEIQLSIFVFDWVLSRALVERPVTVSDKHFSPIGKFADSWICR
jgi:hypothetical protein